MGHSQCVVTREGFEFSLGDNLIDEPHAQGILGAKVGPGREENLLGIRRTNQLHELFHAVVVIPQAQARCWNAKACVVGRKAHVTGDGNADATPTQ